MPEEPKKDVLLRLKKIEGQVRGLQRMIEEGKDCTEVVHQLSAARKALDKVGFIILSRLMSDCLKRKGEADADKQLEDAMELFLSLS
jgi:CsoR family transcriptional regulator, copper-sensing transcriptional repressor